MAVKIRLTRIGKRDRPFYRIVIMDESTRRDGRFIAHIGYYDPTVKPAKIDIDQEALSYWQSKGAQPTDGVKKLLKS